MQQSMNLVQRPELTLTRQQERVKRMVQVIESFSSGFTLRPVSVKLVNTGQAPAFSSSNRIWFHEGMLADLSTKHGVASLKGLTLHEISHILLSPRANSELREWVNAHGYQQSWNALEDQRIESQLIALYPSIKDWFTATISEHLLKDPNGLTKVFPLIHGRRYLDKQVRQAVRKGYFNQKVVKELSTIIDKFRALNMSDPDTL